MDHVRPVFRYSIQFQSFLCCASVSKMLQRLRQALAAAPEEKASEDLLDPTQTRRKPTPSPIRMTRRQELETIKLEEIPKVFFSDAPDAEVKCVLYEFGELAVEESKL